MYAVLTGDLVKSRRLDHARLRQAQQALAAAAAEVDRAAWGGSPILSGDIDFFRGDAWQCALQEPRWALRTALYLRTTLLVQGLSDTRIAVGIGSVTGWSTERVSLSTGPAFELSGQALDAMGPRFRMALAIAPDAPCYFPWCDVVAHLCDSIVTQWEGRQIATAQLRLLDPNATHAALGRRLTPAVSQQAVSKSLANSGWHGIGEALDRFEAVVDGDRH